MTNPTATVMTRGTAPAATSSRTSGRSAAGLVVRLGLILALLIL